MIKKLAFMAVGVFVLIGCGDTASILNGDTTAEDIKAKANVLIITQVGEFSCSAIGIAVKTEYPNAKTLIADMGVTCATYNHTADCTIQTLEEWKNAGNNADGIPAGDKACVVGGDSI